MVLWRISNYDTLNGIGGLKAPGRWHTRGHRVVYLSSSPAAALLEILVHFEIQPGKLPWGYKLLEIQVPDDLQIEKISQVTGLPPNWVAEQIATQQIGDNWLEKHSSPLLEVPSAIVPRTSNYLLNLIIRKLRGSASSLYPNSALISVYYDSKEKRHFSSQAVN